MARMLGAARPGHKGTWGVEIPAAAQVDDPSGRLAEQRHAMEDPAALAADHPEACTGPPAVTPVQMEALHRLHASPGGPFYRSPRTRDALEHLGLIAYHPAQGWDLTPLGRELIGGTYYPDNGASGRCRNGQPVRWICGTSRGPGAWWHANADRCTATPQPDAPEGGVSGE